MSHSLATALLFCAPAMAQVSATLSVLTPITLDASTGTATSSFTQPVGPLTFSSSFHVQTTGGANAAALNIYGGVSDLSVDFVFNHQVVNTGPGFASVGTHEILLQITAPVPTRGRVQVGYADLTPAGAPQPQANVDVGNDGTIDFVNGQPTIAPASLVVGPQPLAIRIIMTTNLAFLGATTSVMVVHFVPDNNIDVTLAAVGCGAFAANIAPIFAGSGVRISNSLPAPLLTSRAFVFGLSTQPLLFPSPTPQPCLLLPQPDVVLWLPGIVAVDFAIPAAVRPVTFWVQPVDAALLRTGSCHRVDAH